MRHECMACRSLHNASTECKMPAVLQGNDIGQERSMTYREVLQEVCRVVRPSLPPSKLAGSIRLLVHLCSAAVSYIAPGATALPTLPAAVKQTLWVASCGVRDMRLCHRPTGSSRRACGRAMLWRSTCRSSASCPVRGLLSPSNIPIM